MPESQDPIKTKDPSFKPIMRSLALELMIYVPLVAGYYILVMSLAKDFLVRLYYEDIVMYAFVTILVILGAPPPRAFWERIFLGRVAPKFIASTVRSTFIVRDSFK